MSPAIYQQLFAAVLNQSKEPVKPSPQKPRAKRAEQSLDPVLKKGKRNALG